MIAAILAAITIKEPITLRDMSAAVISMFGVVFIAKPPFIFGGIRHSDDPGTISRRLLGVM
jgi:drug/metabolite transporter (DMT)-like permease